MTGPKLVRAPRIKRECTHTHVRHEHGTATAYKRDRCRCAPCTDAATSWERRRRLDEHIGAEPRRVDATAAREHILALRAQGVGYRQVAALSGIAHSTILKIVSRDRDRADGLPQQRVAPATEQAILAVVASMDVVSDGAVIDGTGTVRRLQALHACGWSRRALAARLGVEHGTLNHIAATGRTSGRMARAVRDLYDEVWDQAPPSATPHDRAAITRTLLWAGRHGWPPPMAWDDDQIDDPAARPRGARPSTERWAA